MNAISVRLEPLKRENIKHQKEHDERKYPPSKMPKYIDRTKTHLNSVIIKSKSEQEIIDEIERRRDKANKKQKQKLKKNATLLYSGIITFGTEAQPIIESLPKQQQDKLFYNVAKAVADYLNTDLESLNIHRDETAIHAHFTIYAYDRNGEPLTRKVKPDTLSKIQDVAAERVKHLGINRGKKKYERIQDGDDLSKIIHRSVKELHQDLPKEIEKKKQELAMLETKITELKMSIGNLLKNKQKIQQEIEAEKKKHEEERQRQKEEKEKELKRYQEQLQILMNDVKRWRELQNDIERQIKEKQEELKRLINNIANQDYKKKYEEARDWYYYVRDILRYVFDAYDLYKERWLFEEIPDLYSILNVEKVEKQDRERNNNPNSPKM